MFRQYYARCPVDGTPLTELERDPLVGASFADRYIIEDCIGEGGMGRVYRARHQRVSRKFAVKVLYGDHVLDPKMRERFAREAESASRLSHPNVISVVDFGEADRGQLYLVMDYVEGRELATVVMNEGPMAPERVWRILDQLCQGLAHAHENGLIHRDFKGDNVILTGSGSGEIARIVDFGLAVMTEVADYRLTTEGMVLGTPAFMSPEQATGEGVDHRTDLFSLGIVLYHMLSGVLPFEGSPVAIAQQNLSCDPPLIHNRVPGLRVDGSLENIARKLMAKVPAERYQSAREVIAAMEMARTASRSRTEPLSEADTLPTTAAHLRAQTESTPSPPPAPSLGPWTRRALSAGIALAIAALVLVLLRSTEPGEPPAGHMAQEAPPEVTVASVAASPPPPEPAAAPAAELAAETAPAAKTAPQPARPAAEEPAGDAADQPASEVEDEGRRPAPARAGEARGRDRGSSKKTRDRPRRAETRRAISTTTLAELYKRVGRDLDELIKQRGEEAAEPLQRIYRSIPLQDALRTPALRRDAYDKLGKLKRRIRRASN